MSLCFSRGCLKKGFSRRLRAQAGFTIAEVLLAVAILAFTLCGILATYLTCFNLAGISKNTNIATSAAQGIIEQLRATAFPQISPAMQFSVNGITYNSTLVSGNIYVWKFPVPISSMRAKNMIVVYIDFTDPDLLKVTVSVCWQQGSKVIGEDLNLNGMVNAGEDINGNGLIDSPVELITQIASR